MLWLLHGQGSALKASLLAVRLDWMEDELDKLIGVIASVRHILSVGSSLTLSIGKTPEAFERGIIELLVNGGIVVALVLAIFMTRVAERQPGSNPGRKSEKA